AKYPPPPANSKMAQITDGMRESDVMKIMGPPDDSKAYVTGKAFIPFYYGGDSTRFAAYWKGQGRVIFQGGNAWGAGRGDSLATGLRRLALGAEPRRGEIEVVRAPEAADADAMERRAVAPLRR